MAVPVFIRFLNLPNVSRISNVAGTSSNRTKFLTSLLRLCSTGQNVSEGAIPSDKNVSEEAIPSDKTDQMDGLSKAMKAYLKRSQKYEEFMKEETIAYETGKRHLANMMGKDPENFTQKDINESLKYLFPSGLYDPRARPMMKSPEKTFPIRKDSEFGPDGKPFNSFFYTKHPNYYKALHHIVDTLHHLDDLEDKYIASHGVLPLNEQIDNSKRIWLTQQDIEEKLIEKLSDEKYEYFIKTLQKLMDHRMSKHAKDLIMEYSKLKKSKGTEQSLLPILHGKNGRPYVSVYPCKRKTAVAKVLVWGNGTGKITINGEDLSYFRDIHTREQVIFPLIFTNMIEKVDIEATVEGGGPTGQSGAIRWGIAWGLRSFLPPDIIDNMKIAGLLTRDLRRRERKKFGQEGARRKFSWNKR